MAVQPLKLRTRFNLQCYTYEGIEAIKQSLIEAKRQTSDEQFTLIFQLIASPEYKVEVVTRDKNGGVQRLEKALSIIQEEIKKRGGIYKLIQGPTRIGTREDDVDNEDILANLARNQEDESDENESNEEGIDIDLNDDVQDAEDDDENDQ